ncbi:MAG TPA: SAM-dependent methyltransferase [Methylibium sp.]|uniref:class I SAM-dependent methyltransferase n=1 Tax=Methylibium sp. TaxID=2067992 RepID=UPI002DB7067B|nr:SAM-dependent methyltransferase [Methylibium sp.]HEU4457894.1 SAM-dependent methyltransferase [Methylibium sp.]
MPAPPSSTDRSPRERCFDAVRAAFAAGELRRLVLAGPRAGFGGPQRIEARPIALKRGLCLSLVEHHATRDLTRNLDLDAALAEIDARVGRDFDNLHLITPAFELQLAVSRKGRETLRRSERAAVALVAAETAAAMPAPAPHDRAKRRPIDIASPFLGALGVTDAEHRLVPAMARKWKQINRFVELLAPALEGAGLAAPKADGAPVRVLDVGSGKGYLSFAVHEHLARTLGLRCEVLGLDLKDDMVALGNATARRLGLDGLRFEHGDVSAAAARLGEAARGGASACDVLIALHACDTATDHAMHAGIRARAKVIMCSPCCHKELRPQMRSPTLLLPLLRHGIHLAQEAEMLTDGLRALLLDAEGYETQVFEFVSLEHTSKNKMVLAVRRAEAPTDAGAPLANERGERIRAQVRELKNFYGVQEQALETLLSARAD